MLGRGRGCEAEIHDTANADDQSADEHKRAARSGRHRPAERRVRRSWRDIDARKIIVRPGIGVQ